MSARIELRWFTPRHAILVGRSAAEVAQRLWVEQSTKEGLDIASPAPRQRRRISAQGSHIHDKEEIHQLCARSPSGHASCEW